MYVYSLISKYVSISSLCQLRGPRSNDTPVANKHASHKYPDFQMHSLPKGTRDLRDMADSRFGKNLEYPTVPKCKENAQ